MQIISPVDGKPHFTATPAADVGVCVEMAAKAQREWRKVDIAQRKQIVAKFVDAFVAQKDAIAHELAWLIGRPVKQNLNEVRGFEERARHLLDISEVALKHVQCEDKPGFRRFVKPEPLGVVFVIGVSLPSLLTPFATIYINCRLGIIHI